MLFLEMHFYLTILQFWLNTFLMFIILEQDQIIQIKIINHGLSHHFSNFLKLILLLGLKFNFLFIMPIMLIFLLEKMLLQLMLMHLKMILQKRHIIFVYEVKYQPLLSLLLHHILLLLLLLIELILIIFILNKCIIA